MKHTRILREEQGKVDTRWAEPRPSGCPHGAEANAAGRPKTEAECGRQEKSRPVHVTCVALKHGPWTTLTKSLGERWEEKPAKMQIPEPLFQKLVHWA